MKYYLVLLFTILTITACGQAAQADAVAHVDLQNLQPLPTPSQESIPLRVAVAAVISPKGTVESYSSLMDYLSEKTGRPVELVQRRTYLEINDLIERGDVDLAFVCTSAYIDGHDKFGMRLLVAPQVKGKTSYQSYLIVPSDSDAQNMADLKDKVFAFTDPISLTGRVYPTYMVEKLGSTTEAFFGRTFFTYSHDEAIYAVANHLADGAAVDSLVYDFAVANDPTLLEKTRVIHRSPFFGIPPVVIGATVRPQVADQLQTILLDMPNNSAGLDALTAIGVDQFVLVDDSSYEGVRNLIEGVPPIGLP
jgi:phosphonate transport system substrate-binding protein